LKNRFYLIVLGLAFIVIIGIAAAASSGGKKPATNVPGQVVCTIRAEVGVDNITVANLNTGQSIIKTNTMLPFSFNCTKGDIIQLRVKTMNEYSFNAWVFNTGTFDNRNPLLWKMDADTTMTACVLMTSNPIE
jgi:hypothetical protein